MNLNNEILNRIIEKNLVSNAYIFYGPEDVGKEESALKFISSFLQKYTHDLNAYTKIKENNYPDYLLIEPTYLLKGILTNQSNIENKNTQKTKPLIRIEQIRNIKDFLSKNSIQSDKKFILIKEAQFLNESASNCLLKILEEPNNAVFILLTSRLNLLKNTIISRCQIIKFKPFSQKELKKFLDEKIYLNHEKSLENLNLENLIFISNGSPGKLLNNLELWKNIPENIRINIDTPLKNYERILFLAKDITDQLDINHQEFLIDYIAIHWWKKTKSKQIAEILEGIKFNINANLQQRLSWEVGLLKISFVDY